MLFAVEMPQVFDAEVHVAEILSGLRIRRHVLIEAHPDLFGLRLAVQVTAGRPEQQIGVPSRIVGHSIGVGTEAWRHRSHRCALAAKYRIDVFLYFRWDPGAAVDGGE